ncbi:hypothetical protein DSECCO2_418220 [anaerobic digester metagenome]
MRAVAEALSRVRPARRWLTVALAMSRSSWAWIESCLARKRKTTLMTCTKAAAPRVFRMIMDGAMMRTSSRAWVNEWDRARTMPMCMVSPTRASPAAQRQSTLRSLRYRVRRPATAPSIMVERPHGTALNPPMSMRMRCPPAMSPEAMPTIGPPKRPPVITAMARRLATDWKTRLPP